MVDRLTTPRARLELDVERITDVMAELSCKRPIFHSEADFQHALAWQIKKIVPDCEVRLEYKPDPDERMYVDIWLSLSGLRVALELKYTTQILNHKVAGELFSLKHQGARDIRRYDFLKDIERLETLVQLGKVRDGFAILLTNDSAYWKKRSARSADTFDAQFHLYDGRKICGELAWKKGAGRGTTKKREAHLFFKKRYKLLWREYGNVDTDKHSEFRYLLVHVRS